MAEGGQRIGGDDRQGEDHRHQHGGAKAVDAPSSAAMR
jgi:hypothetical protein